MTDTATLRCAHGLELFVGMVKGTYHYTHPDGRSCDINNSLAVTCEKVLTLHAARAPEGSPQRRAAFACSKEYRLRYYKALATLKDADALSRALGQVAAMMDGAFCEKTIAWELEKVFGKIVWENFDLVAPQTMYAATATAPKQSYPLPKLTMLNIKNERETAGFAELDESVQASQKRWGR